MDANLAAGVAIFNAGEYHAAHDAWEDRWLDCQSGTPDERFLHGLIQFTAAVYHAHGNNWEGVRGLAESGASYLADHPADYRDVNVETVRRYLRATAADPEHVERRSVPRLTYEGRPILPEDLDFESAVVAAAVLAEEYGYEEWVVERAAEFGRRDIEDGRANSRFVAFVTDFARDDANRALLFRRLRQSVEERLHREEDVDGLFESRE